MPNEENVAATETELRRLFHEALKALNKEDLRPSSPCPDSETMVSYVTGKASDDVRKEINAHLAFCDTCWDDYVALTGPEKIAELIRTTSTEEEVSLPITIQHAKERWSEFVTRAKEHLIDLGRTYGPGALIGSVKILAEGPVPALRGETTAYKLSKVIEVSIGDNVYGIEIQEHQANISFDVAGYKMTQMIPMRLAVQLESGEELTSAETDNHGYARIKLLKERLPGEEFALTFTLEDEMWEMLFLRLPEEVRR